MTKTYDQIMESILGGGPKTTRNLSTEAAAQTRSQATIDAAALRAVDSLTESLRKAERDGVPAKIAVDTYRARLKAQASMQGDVAALLKAGVTGTATENAAQIHAAAVAAAAKIQGETRALDKSYSYYYNQMVGSIERNTQADPADPAGRSKLWQATLANVDPTTPGLNHLVNQAVAKWGDPRTDPVVSADLAQDPTLHAKLVTVFDAAKKQEDTNANLEGALAKLGAGGEASGPDAYSTAIDAVRRYQDAFGGNDTAIQQAGQEAEADARNNDAAVTRIKQELDSADALAFPKPQVDDTLTREKVAAIVASPRFQRFAAQHGWTRIGTVNAEGEYTPGADDLRVIRAGLHSYAGRDVMGPAFRAKPDSGEVLQVATKDGPVAARRIPLRVNDPDGDVIRVRLPDGSERVLRNGDGGTQEELTAEHGVPTTPTQPGEPHTGDEPGLPEVPEAAAAVDDDTPPDGGEAAPDAESATVAPDTSDADIRKMVAAHLASRRKGEAAPAPVVSPDDNPDIRSADRSIALGDEVAQTRAEVAAKNIARGGPTARVTFDTPPVDAAADQATGRAIGSVVSSNAPEDVALTGATNRLDAQETADRASRAKAVAALPVDAPSGLDVEDDTPAAMNDRRRIAAQLDVLRKKGAATDTVRAP